MSNITSKVVCITSGKGGVGKTTTAAAIAAELANCGKKTVVIDFDIGLRNLDIIMGCENRVVFDFINVINNKAKLDQALIKDSRLPNLYILPASQVKDKSFLIPQEVEKIITELRTEFEYIICDSPAGIGHGAQMSLYCADEVIVVINAELTSVRDSDRILGIINSQNSNKKVTKDIKQHLLLTRYQPARVEKKQMLCASEIETMLKIPLLGIIPESAAVLDAASKGLPVTLHKPSNVRLAYQEAVARLLGKVVHRKSWLENFLYSIKNKKYKNLA